jgi:hypothetical protein
VVLDLRRDRRVDGPVTEAFPVEAVEPPETNELNIGELWILGNGTTLGFVVNHHEQ